MFLTKIICKIFKLIPREIIVDKMTNLLFTMAMSKDRLKEKYAKKEITEWTYYKKLWQLMGRLSMLEDLIKNLE